MTLTGQKVLVTGANGFIGGAVVRRLLADGVVVRGLVRSEAKGAEIAGLGAEVAIGDLTDAVALQQAVAGCDIVLNVGAALHGDEAEQRAVNVEGVRLMVDVCSAAGVKRLVHVSTIAVYGYDRHGTMDESMPPQPGREYYGQSKAEGEQLLLAHAKTVDLDGAVIRPGMVYGPRSGFWTGKVFNLMNRRIPLIPGDGSTYCPVVFIDDVVDLLLTAAVHPAAVGEVFNAVSAEPVTWRDYLGGYAAMAGRHNLIGVPVPVLQAATWLVEPLLARFSEPQPVHGMVNALMAHKRIYSMAKAARLLRWQPQVGLAEGLARSAEWLRETGQLES